MATKGLGVDRHILAFQLLGQQEHVSHPFLSSKFVKETCHWRLSTSQLPSPFCAVGFGPVVPDGYGVWYSIRRDHVIYTLTNWIDSNETDVKQLAKYMLLAFAEIRSLFEQSSSNL